MAIRSSSQLSPTSNIVASAGLNFEPETLSFKETPLGHTALERNELKPNKQVNLVKKARPTVRHRVHGNNQQG